MEPPDKNVGWGEAQSLLTTDVARREKITSIAYRVGFSNL